MRHGHTQLEVALRFRSADGVLMSEHTIRGPEVELLSFFPSGKISEHTTVSLDTYYHEMQKNLAERLRDTPYLEEQ